jgi:outer membrane protein assembly factor BamD
MKRLLSLLLVIIFFASCNEYQKALKSEDNAVKLAEGTKQYDKGNYSKAIRLFEPIMSSYKGKPQAERMFYQYAMAHYTLGKKVNAYYYTAAYQFESFASSYPKSEKREEASFLGAKSYSLVSPVYSLDQIDTDKAIEKMQIFIDTYPESTYLPEANTIVKNLKIKLEKKYFEVAKQYNTISNYKSAIIALDNFVADYPGTPFKEDALYYKLDSAYKLATNSIEQRKQERLISAKSAYSSLMKFKSDTKYKKVADQMLVTIDKELQQFSK